MCVQEVVTKKCHFCIVMLSAYVLKDDVWDVALGVKRNGEWVTWTYEDYWHEVRRAARDENCSLDTYKLLDLKLS